jgi:hypothetical protein
MNDEWYAEDSSYSTADLICGGKPTETLFGPVSPSCLTSQIRELLGEGCELEASFLEESWASGRPVTPAKCRPKRDRATENIVGVTFADLSTVGSFFSPAADGLMGDRPAYAYPASSRNSYAAAWLHDPLEEFVSRTEDRAAVRDSARDKRRAATDTFDSMTYQRACELLSVGDGSTVTQIRAAYRRMVGEWHPDRLEQSSERVRAFATQQMASINEAYHLLRDFSPASAC